VNKACLLGLSLAFATLAHGETGRDIAHGVNKGNCLACHAMPTDAAAITSATIGPPLLKMRERFPDRERLRKQIDDPTQFNDDTVMPPYGRNQVLTASEIEQLIDYLYSL
jgi:L-cysteine S-thiosulfotransferase